MRVEREKLSIPGPVGSLEAILEYASEGQPRALAVVCHPHPQFEGTMHNKVAYTLARAAAQSGAATLRFNFRGVGESAGSYGGGRGELEDFRAAERWLRERCGDLPRWRLGFSFGAAIIIKACLADACQTLVTVAPPTERFADSALDGAPPQAERWLLVQGGADEVISAQATLDWARSFDAPPDIEVFEGVGHFFHGHLTALRQRVCDVLTKADEELH